MVEHLSVVQRCSGVSSDENNMVGELWLITVREREPEGGKPSERWRRVREERMTRGEGYREGETTGREGERTHLVHTH